MSVLTTVPRLGLASVGRVFAYRMLCRSGVYLRLLPEGRSYDGPFFALPPRPTAAPDLPADERQFLIRRADRLLDGYMPFFSASEQHTGFPPDWSRNPANGIRLAPAGHWTSLSEHALSAGDIKYLWEPSRFDGLLWLAQGWLLSGERRFAEGIERWLASWVAANPFNQGVNWKCGQETGIRLIHTLLLADWLSRHGGGEALAPLLRFVAEHCRRIRPTLLYALGQDNNHATSEAAALYMAGLWLRRRPSVPPALDRSAAVWQAIGRRLLSERLSTLVMPDGSFAQHSVTYHRLLLDTLALVEDWRKRFADEPFDASWYDRAAQAVAWLAAMTDPVSGDAPNLGANDGARLLPIDSAAYRDFRPSLGWAAQVLGGADPPLGASNMLLAAWFASAPGAPRPPLPRPRLFPFGGYVRLGGDRRWALLRLPTYRFRPAHADALHLDVWSDGINLLRDGGSFSYRPALPEAASYYPGTVSHNTVQFDQRDQMPRIGRFLFADWLRLRGFEYDAAIPDQVAAEYVDRLGARHRRLVRFLPDRIEVEDDVSGFAREACLRWRLAPAGWYDLPDGVGSQLARLTVAAGEPLDVRRTGGHESRHYGEQSPLDVLEVRAYRPTVLRTSIVFC